MRPTLPEVAKHAGEAVAEVEDAALKDALRALGEEVLSQGKAASAPLDAVVRPT